MRCVVMSCDALRCPAIRCDVLRCAVVSYDALGCHVMPCDAVLMLCNAAEFLPRHAALMCCNAATILPRGYCGALRCPATHCDGLRCVMCCTALPCGAALMCCDAAGIPTKRLRWGLRGVPGLWSHRERISVVPIQCLIRYMSVRTSVTPDWTLLGACAKVR